jgi:hypothetical protein
MLWLKLSLDYGGFILKRDIPMNPLMDLFTNIDKMLFTMGFTQKEFNLAAPMLHYASKS